MPQGLVIDQLREGVTSLEPLDTEVLGVPFGEDIALYAVSSGPLCAGILGFGKLSREDATELMRGTNMEQQQRASWCGA